ncbi:hypothetical protein EVAR_20514_1 [Eumeta japonica]|uniref:Uncharacterized protein n=1 Tax=Eumeta variegata TaxID=151549 RepID=A0A4C1VJW5_EUMVA|nr:hypothetical protein EVAR_20514_1 [Eumeta japonica]
MIVRYRIKRKKILYTLQKKATTELNTVSISTAISHLNDNKFGIAGRGARHFAVAAAPRRAPVGSASAALRASSGSQCPSITPSGWLKCSTAPIRRKNEAGWTADHVRRRSQGGDCNRDQCARTRY